ncbi:MAG TPA: P1 family peptidase [Gemmatimonadaceae bacterium]|nr:P1 family peptidase [Gemmatimonadaceae bacterium]
MSGAAAAAADFSRFGAAVGHATDAEGATGLTVVRGTDGPLRGAAAVVGRATGTRELQALVPGGLAGRVDAVLLTGGSAYGLDAAAGVMRWMEERGRGFPIGPGVVPIVPAAVIFDLAPLGRYGARPTPAMAYEACDAARPVPAAEGSVGAGTGATVGKSAGIQWAMKGGVGCAVAESGDAAAGAVAVVNAFGDVRDERGAILAGARAPGGGFADGARLLAEGAAPLAARPSDVVRTLNTTLAAVLVSAPLPRIALQQLAAAAAAALYRRITPAGTSFDGDIIFALAPFGDPQREPPDSPPARLQLEALAVRALEHAIERAVRLARGRDGVPGLGDE